VHPALHHHLLGVLEVGRLRVGVDHLADGPLLVAHPERELVHGRVVGRRLGADPLADDVGAPAALGGLGEVLVAADLLAEAVHDEETEDGDEGEAEDRLEAHGFEGEYVVRSGRVPLRKTHYVPGHWSSRRRSILARRRSVRNRKNRRPAQISSTTASTTGSLSSASITRSMPCGGCVAIAWAAAVSSSAIVVSRAAARVSRTGC